MLCYATLKHVFSTKNISIHLHVLYSNKMVNDHVYTYLQMKEIMPKY